MSHLLLTRVGIRLAMGYQSINTKVKPKTLRLVATNVGTAEDASIDQFTNDVYTLALI